MSPWWRSGAIYQVYLRSFQDSDGDGIGDLPGLLRRLPYLAELGVAAVWLSPIHPSPDVDFGYDVSDYLGIHPAFGTQADFDAVVTRAEQLGLHVLLDGVFNHTSDQHAWFVQSRSSRESSRADWYLWRDRPNNWKSTFGGPAWTYAAERGQFYLHSFAPEQPDLNWRDPEVVDAVLEVMAHWFDRGVKGMRLDVFNCYLKHPELTDNPRRLHPAAVAYGYLGQHHAHDRDQPELAEALARLRALADRHDAVLIGETLDERFRYDNAAQWVGPERLHLAFHFRLLHSRWGARPFRDAIAAWTGALDERWPTWVLSNHDFVRAVSRWGNRDDRARLIALMQCTLRGTPVLFQGEELGQREARLARRELLDPPGKRYWPVYRGRDGCRTPMAWDRTAHAGFSTVAPWLPARGVVPPVTEQAERADSVLETWRAVLALRAAHPALHRGSQEGLQAEASVLTWTRDQRVRVLLNLGDRTRTHSHRGRLLYSTHGETHRSGRLQPCEGVVLDAGRSSEAGGQSD